MQSSYVADGRELDFRGLDSNSDQARLQRLRAPDGSDTLDLTVETIGAVDLVGLRFMEGDHRDGSGWFENLAFQVRQDGVWIDLPTEATMSEDLDPDRPFQWIDVDFGRVLAGIDAWRLTGTPGSSDAEVVPWVSIAEFDGILHTAASGYFLDGDYNGDGWVSQADLDLVLLNWGGSELPETWAATHQFDGVLVSQNELDAVLLNWGSGTAPAATAIPEPATGLWLAGMLGLAGRRRTARKSKQAMPQLPAA